MAKTRTQSSNSRAARRASSPGLDVDKSLTSLPRAEDTTFQRDTILADRANAGVTKKKSKPKAKSRAQKERQQKGMDRAENVLDQMEIKVAKSVKRGKNVKARRAEWEDLNRKKQGSMFQGLEEDKEDDNNAMVDDSTSANPNPQPAFTLPNSTAEEPEGKDEDDEIT